MFAALAALCLIWAIHMEGGNYHPVGLFLLLAGMLSAGAATFIDWRWKWAERTLLGVLAGGAVLHLVFLAARPAGLYAASLRGGIAICYFLLVGACSIGVGLALWRRWSLAGRLLLLAGWASIAMLVLRLTPAPLIDVFTFQQESMAALEKGRNPYAIDFRNPYGDGTPYLDAGLQRNGRILTGYPYPPLPLLLTLPGFLLAGDVRYAYATMALTAGALLLWMRNDARGVLGAALFLFLPPHFHMIEMAWTEPLSAMFLAATIWCAQRRSRLTFLALGLLIASKQYLVLALPLAALLLRPGWRWPDLWKLTGGAVAVALLVSLPMALWDIRAFVHSAVEFQIRQPFRLDSLSLAAWWARHIGGQPPAALGFAAAVVAMAACLWRSPRSAGGFALSLAVVLLAFFAFGKQAFINYYYLVIAALCCAVAANGYDAPVSQTHGPAILQSEQRR